METLLVTTGVVVVVSLAATAVATKIYHIWTRPGWGLRNKHVFITGGSSGLGLCVARHCYAEGARVTIVARNIAQLNLAKADIVGDDAGSEKADRVQVRVCDVSSMEMLEEAVHVAARIHARNIDVLFCCAGMALPGMFEDQAVSVHEHQMQVNYLGTVRAVKAVLPQMQEQKSGTIVLVSSMAAFYSIPGYLQYSPTKAALKSFAEGLRAELLPQNIGVHIFFPGNLDTPGFEKENQMKPSVTHEIEGSSTDLVTPTQAALHLINAISGGEWLITNELFGYFGQSASGIISGHRNWALDILVSPLVVFFGELYSLWVAHVMRKAQSDDTQKRKTL